MKSLRSRRTRRSLVGRVLRWNPCARWIYTHGLRMAAGLRARVGPALLLVLIGAVAASAQYGYGRRRLPEGAGAYPPRYLPKDFEGGTVMVCKLQYTSVRYEAMGIGWST